MPNSNSLVPRKEHDVKLTERQEAFLDALFGEAQGNPTEAARIAGYSEHSLKNSYRYLRDLKEEIIERATNFLALHSPKAAMALTNTLDNPTSPGITAKITAAQTILDRVGIVKHDKIDLNTDMPIGLFILPAKREVRDPTKSIGHRADPTTGEPINGS